MTSPFPQPHELQPDLPKKSPSKSQLLPNPRLQTANPGQDGEREQRRRWPPEAAKDTAVGDEAGGPGGRLRSRLELPRRGLRRQRRLRGTRDAVPVPPAHRPARRFIRHPDARGPRRLPPTGPRFPRFQRWTHDLRVVRPVTDEWSLSLLAFLAMASNEHGNRQQLNLYEDNRTNTSWIRNLYQIY